MWLGFDPRQPVPLAGLVVWALLFGGLLFGAGQAHAQIYYQLEFDTARLTGQSIFEDGRKFTYRTQGGGLPARILPDRQKGSGVLVLRTEATPAGAKKDRAEVQIYSGITFDRDWFVGLEVLVPRAVTFSDTWHLLLQCPQAGTGRPPPLSLNLEPNGDLSLVARDDGDTYDRLWPAPCPAGAGCSWCWGSAWGRTGWSGCGRVAVLWPAAASLWAGRRASGAAC